jgi:hypothetical protein
MGMGVATRWAYCRRSTRPLSRSAAIPRAAADLLAVVALGAAAVGTVLLGPVAAASPAPNGWGPGAIPYRSGVICSGDAGSSALVAWPSAATGAAAFALSPVTAGPGGAHAALPAVDSTTSAPYQGPDGAVLAALLARHGTASAAGAVADVAAAVLHPAGLDPVAAGCLATGEAGATTSKADELWAEAGNLAGPYTLHLRVAIGTLVLGRPARLIATVSSATGAGVPGVVVDFGTDGPGAEVRRGSTVTDASGRATTTVTASVVAAARSANFVARAHVPGTPDEISAPGEVSLVAAGAPTTMTRRIRVPIDTTADPKLSLSVDHGLVLPGAVVHPSLSVTGMRGHTGSAHLSISGPLPLSASTGCTRYSGAAAGSRDPATRTASAPSTRLIDVRGDATVRGAPLTPTRPGCYVLSADITTTDAIPNVHRTGARAVVAVAPLQVTVDPAGHGVSTPGRLTASVRVTGRLTAHLADLQATVVGPARSDDGSCTDAHFPTGGGTPVVPTAVAGTRLTSAAVTAPGCYAFRVLGTVQIPHLGAVPLSSGGAASATTLVLTPSATVTALSAAAATAGNKATATVTVSGTWTQPGAVRLDLLHLPYTWHGCFDRDWTGATHVPMQGPATRIRGDGDYRVSTSDITGSGCWTVVPVLTLTRNPAITVRDSAPVDPMTAFTTAAAATAPTGHQVALHPSDGTGRVITAASLMLALLIIALVSTLRIALRDAADQ